jgi:hypothetical protein
MALLLPSCPGVDNLFDTNLAEPSRLAYPEPAPWALIRFQVSWYLTLEIIPPPPKNDRPIKLTL